MLKVIDNGAGKFQLKEVDAEGNSIRVLPQEFDSELKAHQFMEALDRGVGEEEAAAQAEASTEVAGEQATVADEGAKEADENTAADASADTTNAPVLKKYKVAVEGFELDGQAYALDSEIELADSDVVASMVADGAIVEVAEQA